MANKKRAGIELYADMKQLRVELQSATQQFKEFDKNAVRSSLGLKSIEDSAKRAASSTRSFWDTVKAFAGGNLLATATTRVAALFKNFIFGAKDAASAFTELESKAKVTFGATFDAVLSKSSDIAREVGRASSAVLKFATDIGSIIKSFGIAGPMLDNMSTSLAKLAIDMASFSNSTDEEAFNALRSGITGETEPLKRFGIVLTDTNLKLFALEKGIKTKVEAMNQGQKTALRYAYIMEKTKDAQGDAARTADSYANQARRLAGELQTTQEILGKTFTPGLASVLGMLNQTIVSSRQFIKALVSDIVALKTALGSFPGLSQIKQMASDAFNNLPGMDIAKSLMQARNMIGGTIQNRLASENQDFLFGTRPSTYDPLAEFDKIGGAQMPSGGGSKAKTQKELLEDLADAEKDIVDALGDQAQKRKEIIEKQRDDLKLKRDMGIITKEEQRTLDGINRRIAFSEDAIGDATDAWKEQKDAIEDIEEKIADINKAIADEQAKLQETLLGIDTDAKEAKFNKLVDLAKELRELELQPQKSLEDENRMREINTALDPYRLTEEGRETLKEVDRVKGLDDFQQIDEDANRKKREAEAKAFARVQELDEELAGERKKLAEVQKAEEEKKKVVIDALAARQIATQESNALIEENLRLHTDKVVGMYREIEAAALRAARAGSGATGGAAPAFANGGPVFGPGGPTGDKIKAWLSDGEFVVRAAATKMYRPLLEQINSMTMPMPKFANGGPVSVTNSNDQTITVNQHNHGEAARYAPDKRSLLWALRKFR